MRSRLPQRLFLLTMVARCEKQVVTSRVYKRPLPAKMVLPTRLSPQDIRMNRLWIQAVAESGAFRRQAFCRQVPQGGTLEGYALRTCTEPMTPNVIPFQQCTPPTPCRMVAFDGHVLGVSE